MASKIEDREWNETQHFSDLEILIENNFEDLIIKLLRRKDELLEELKILRDEFTLRHSESYDSLLKMRESRTEMISLLEKIESETAKESFQKTFQDLEENLQLEERKLLLKQKEVRYLWDPEEFDLCLPNLGKLNKKHPLKFPSQSSIEYRDLTYPQMRFGRHGKKKGEFSFPRCFTIEEEKEKILVADGKNSRIQVWDLSGTYLFEFGKKHLKQPWGICVSLFFVFVSDFELNAIFKFDLNGFALIQRTQNKKGIDPGNLSCPAGMAVKGEHIYIAENGNNRVSVLSMDLNFKALIGKGLLHQPMCVKTAVEQLFVNEMDGTIKQFSEEWKLIKVLKREHIFSNNVGCFCMDKDHNFLVCDKKRNTILVMSPEGKLILSINTAIWGCASPVDIEITRDDRVICSLQEGEYSIVIV